MLHFFGYSQFNPIRYICPGASLPEVECYPRPIMAWTERFYGTVFGPHGDFSLRGHGVRPHLCAVYAIVSRDAARIVPAHLVPCFC